MDLFEGFKYWVAFFCIFSLFALSFVSAMIYYRNEIWRQS